MFGLFGSDKPYKKAMHEYRRYADQAAAAQQPYMNAGNAALGDYQTWLQGMQDPSDYVNNLMGDYQESPYARYLQQQSLNSAQNAASASGLMGSTPLMQQIQQNASNISSGDMNQWLQNVLGINTQYGQGQQNLMQGGQNAANALSGIYNNMGQNMGQAAYGAANARNQDWGRLIGTIGSMFL
jgi:hypothetical protein